MQKLDNNQNEEYVMRLFNKLKDFADIAIDSVKAVKNTKNQYKNLVVNEFNLVGMAYFERNFSKLMDLNPEFKSAKSTIRKNGHIGKRIFKYKWAALPANISSNNTDNPYTYLQVFSKGLPIGYVKECDHKRVEEILKSNSVDSINVFLSGGELRVVGDDNSDFKSDIGYNAKLKIVHYE